MSLEPPEASAGDARIKGGERDHEPTVAIRHASERIENVLDPLEAVGVEISQEPDSLDECDVLICDTPDRGLFKEILRKPLHRTPVLYRMRGDPFWGINEWIDRRYKAIIARRMLTHVDSCLPIVPHQANKWRRRTGVPAKCVGLPVAADDFPTTEHTDGELRITTLTNPVYWPKVAPLVDAAPVVDDVLDDVGGYWRICGEGFKEDELSAALEPYDHVGFAGYVDAQKELGRANLMVHFSNFDALPNAILEGMSSRLPVLVNDHQAFVDSDAPIDVHYSSDELEDTLQQYTNPQRRTRAGEAGLEYVRERHSAERIGEEYVQAIRWLLTHHYFEETHGIPYPEAGSV